jgi:pimeloyl-ACP methyl ester carboxylesterase
MKERLLVACLILGLCASAVAQGPAEAPLLNVADDIAAGVAGAGEHWEAPTTGDGDLTYVDRDGHRIPAAVFEDPPRDGAHPARNRQLLIPSQGKEMNALFFLASGEGPKPTMLLLHGLPGNERNLDLAQAVRRAGWNVLTFTYRGAWGSEGKFSIGGALADSAAAMAFLRSPAAVRDYAIDPKRLVIAGHSMGGFAATLQASIDRDAAGLILLDAWDVGATAREMREGGPAGRAAFIAGFDDLGHALQGATASSLADEVERRGRAWHLPSFVGTLTSKPILTIYATGGGARDNKAFAEALRKAGNTGVTEVALESDHAFADKRIALAAEVVRWLNTLR